MKKLATTLFIAGTALTLAACDTTGTGNVDTAAPYSSERTAGYDDTPAAVPTRERVFREAQSK